MFAENFEKMRAATFNFPIVCCQAQSKIRGKNCSKYGIREAVDFFLFFVGHVATRLKKSLSRKPRLVFLRFQEIHTKKLCLDQNDNRY